MSTGRHIIATSPGMVPAATLGTRIATCVLHYVSLFASSVQESFQGGLSCSLPPRVHIAVWVAAAMIILPVCVCVFRCGCITQCLCACVCVRVCSAAHFACSCPPLGYKATFAVHPLPTPMTTSPTWGILATACSLQVHCGPSSLNWLVELAGWLEPPPPIPPITHMLHMYYYNIPPPTP